MSAALAPELPYRTALHRALNRLRKQAVLVTGGAGFIGSNLVRRLAQAGARVTVVDCMLDHSGANPFNLDGLESAVRIEQLDLRDAEGLASVLPGQGCVFHLAAHTSHVESMRDPLHDLAMNALGTLTLLETLRRVNPAARVVATGTRQVYGTPRYLPVDELHPYAPPDINGIHKLAVDWYGKLYSDVHGMAVTSLRLTNTFGPRMRVRDARQMFLGVWIRQLLQGEPLRVFGSGEQKRDFNYVDEVVDALLLATDDALRGRCLNLGGVRAISLLELARTLVSAFEVKGTFKLEPFPAARSRIDIGDYHGDFRAFARATGWQPVYALEDGLRRTIEFYSMHADRYFP